ncbi:MAG: glycoside hydrolase family 3 N-terminal domain-containing protein [Spirochaetales bacterium]
MKPLSPWVTRTLATLSVDEKIGQLLHPNLRPQATAQQIHDSLPPVRVGGAFVFFGSANDFVRVTNLLQDGPGVPLVISTDLESGAGRMIDGATSFPDLMSTAAAADDTLTALMGEATAVEARAYGVHWTFGPVVDLNMNPGNPITNTRSLGDDVARVSRLARILVQSMQSHGLATTVKHFPGDGWDDRDQHLVTSVNPLSRADWHRLSAKPFVATFGAGPDAGGAWTTMIGHIALPSVDGDDSGDGFGPPPAILSRKVTTDLLRGELGFDGLVVSDAIEMNGSMSRVRNRYELLVRLINAGNDVLLFTLREDFFSLKKAVASGDISLARLDEACTRVLELKERLGFAANPASARPAADPEAWLAPHRARFAAASRDLARKALTLVRSDDQVPLGLKKGDRVLVVHLRANAEYHVDGIDKLLEARGVEVERRTEADPAFAYRGHDFTRYQAVLMLWVVGPTWGTNFIRPSGPWMRSGWFVRYEQPACPVVHVSFGTPYLGHDVPWADTLLNAYSPDISTQLAVVSWLFGELTPTGVSPVDLGRPARMRELLASELTRELDS